MTKIVKKIQEVNRIDITVQKTVAFVFYLLFNDKFMKKILNIV